MTITYSIRNVTTELVHAVMLRKFFQMVFVGEDKKSLHIYTATVLGASNTPGDTDGEDFISNLDMLKQFRMRFEFAIGGADSNEILNIEHEDITESEHGFLNEIDCIQKVWGQKCKIILNCQRDILDKLKEIVGDTNYKTEEQNLNIKTAALSNHRLLWIEEKKSRRKTELLRSLAVAGEYQPVNNAPEENLRDGIAKRKAYTISIPKNLDLPRGIELVNWVRTTIQFKFEIDDTNLNYILKKESLNNTKEQETIFYAPDFTWYFSPKIKTFIDNRKCIVEVKREGKRETESRVCCPYRTEKNSIYLNDKYQNSIDAVPNKLTVDFHYWKEDERINLRPKYRLASKDILPNSLSFNEVSEINMFLDISDEHNRGNRQFILGVFLSFALAFGIDSTRLMQVEPYFGFLAYFLPSDVLWIILLGCFTLTLMRKPLRLSEDSRFLMLFRRLLLLTSILWTLFVFVICRSPLFASFLVDNQSSICIGTASSMLILILAQIVYVFLSKVSPSDKILIDLFGEDIL